ncbi:MAG: hypothetical protein ACYCXF_00795 [Thermoleophilia bacterium]
MIFTTAALLAATALSAALTGCGSDGQTGTSTAAIIQAPDVKHPAPGAIEVVDNKNDVTAENADLSKAPTFVDISWVDLAKEGDNYKFSMEVSGLLPAAPEAGKAVEWGFMLDTDKDGKPEWGVFAALDPKNGWYWAISNQKTKEKVTGAQFPGTFSHDGTTLVWTISAAAIGNATEYKWFAFSNYFTKDATNQNQKASDSVPDLVAADDSTYWLPYP